MQHEVLTQRAAEPCQQVMMLPTTKRTGGPLVFFFILCIQELKKCVTCVHEEDSVCFDQKTLAEHI